MAVKWWDPKAIAQALADRQRLGEQQDALDAWLSDLDHASLSTRQLREVLEALLVALKEVAP